MGFSELSQKVFRLRLLPGWITGLSEAAQLISLTLNISIDDVDVCSIAKTSNIWEIPRSKVATLQLKKIPEIISTRGRNNRSDEWELSCPEAPSGRLILDTHFEGWTVLNDVDANEHHTDCIAISGLASHAFGSWQPKGPDKSFMWIRDELPRSIPGIRTILYGYDSKILDSEVFQTISDIALGFVHQLKTGGWNLESAKPVVFLAHSLGGLVLKDSIVQMAEHGAMSTILSRIRGAIMFGVPSLGMHISHLLAITQGQANDALVRDLSRESTYLRSLDKSFDGLFFIQQIQIYWAYETRETRTILKLPSGKWDRVGPYVVLVSPDSATCRNNISAKHITIPIDEDHSNMVKFPPGDKNLATIITSLTELCSRRNHFGLASILSNNTSAEAIEQPQSKNKFSGPSQMLQRDQETLRKLRKIILSIHWMHEELYSDELDFRIEHIEMPFEDTFRWVFDQPRFCNWLQGGSGLFWVNGKPGSGKSTLMKYIYESRHTWELLHDWRRGPSEVREIKAGFFFHYRGTPLQKSFEGLLRSVLIQIITPHFESFQSRWKNLLDSEKRYSIIRKKIGAKKAEITRIEALIKSLTSEDEPPDLQDEDYEGDKERLEEELARMEVDRVEVARVLSSFAKEFRENQNNTEARFLSELATVFQSYSEGLLDKLEKTLHYILDDQNVIQMDIILFIDALDEFDGHFNMINRFLRSLIRGPEISATRVKICFSSRPWRSFETQFSDFPSFSLQNYTKSDIEKYTVGNLTLWKATYPQILELAATIIAKANGVFLWVKLAVQELLNVVAQDPQPTSQLEKRLDELPSDLHEFYQLIIERIGTFYHRKTFALLELIVRNKGESPLLSVDYAWEAVCMAESSSYGEATEILASHGNEFTNLPDDEVKKHKRNDITMWSGGLVEIKQDHVQMMHQTVLDFVMSLSFKKSVLGDLMSIGTENGHSFHFKYRCLLRYNTIGSPHTNVGEIAYHGEKSELTTGNSQLSFISGIPLKILHRLRAAEADSRGFDIDLLEFIIANGLVLCLRDIITRNPLQLAYLCDQESALMLLDTLLFSPELPRVYESRHTKHHFGERRVSMARQLLENGYKLQHDPHIFAQIVLRMWLAEAGTEDGFGISKSQFLELAIMMLVHGQDPETEIATPEGRATALHLASPAFAAELIRRGANPNGVDQHGRSPLDWIITPPDRQVQQASAKQVAENMFEKCVILANADGKAFKCNYSTWIQVLGGFSSDGFDITSLCESKMMEEMKKRHTGVLSSFIHWFTGQ